MSSGGAGARPPKLTFFVAEMHICNKMANIDTTLGVLVGLRLLDSFRASSPETKYQVDVGLSKKPFAEEEC